MKKLVLNISLLLLATSHVAFAHTASGSLGRAKLGNAATDVWLVNCNDDGGGTPSKLYVRIKDLAPNIAPKISAQIYKNQSFSVLSFDERDGDSGYAPALVLAKGPGDYLVTINKELTSASCRDTKTVKCKGADSYFFAFHCLTKTNDHAGTEYQLIQNQ